MRLAWAKGTQSPASTLRTRRSPAQRASTSGMMFGPYHLLDVLGEGGFGVVFLAERRRADRAAGGGSRIIRPGMDSRAR